MTSSYRGRGGALFPVWIEKSCRTTGIPDGCPLPKAPSRVSNIGLVISSRESGWPGKASDCRDVLSVPPAAAGGKTLGAGGRGERAPITGKFGWLAAGGEAGVRQRIKNTTTATTRAATAVIKSLGKPISPKSYHVGTEFSPMFALLPPILIHRKPRKNAPML